MSDLITQLYNSKDISDCIGYHFDPDCQQDVKQDLFELLMLLKPGTLEEKQERGKLKVYVATIIANMKRQRYGKVAKMVNNYTRFEELPTLINIADESGADKEEMFNEVEEKLNWYQRGIFELYAKLGSIRAVSRVTNIPIQSINYTIREGRKTIKKAW
jgi:hypothetical protein